MTTSIRGHVMAAFIETGEAVTALELARRMKWPESRLYREIRKENKRIDGVSFRAGSPGRYYAELSPTMGAMRDEILRLHALMVDLNGEVRSARECEHGFIDHSCDVPGCWKFETLNDDVSAAITGTEK